MRSKIQNYTIEITLHNSNTCSTIQKYTIESYVTTVIHAAQFKMANLKDTLHNSNTRSTIQNSTIESNVT